MNTGFVSYPGQGLRNGNGPLAASSFTLNRARRNAVPCVRRARIAVMTGAPVEVTEDTFQEEVLDSDVPVIVDFYAAWCGPCKLMLPLMDLAAAEYEGKLKVVKINTDENLAFVDKYNIRGLPTFAVFRKGEVYGVQEGALGKDALKVYIAKHCFEDATV